MQDTYKLPIWDTIENAWKKVKGAKLVIFCGFLTAILINIAIFAISAYFKLESHFVTYFLLTILGKLIAVLLSAGLLLYGLKRSFDLPINYSMLFAAFDRRVGFKIILFYLLMIVILLPIAAIFMTIALVGIFLPTGIAGLVVALIYILTLCSLIYILVRISLAISFILVRGSGPWEAIKLSFAATRGNFWRLFTVKLLTSLFLSISAIPLGIGLIWTIPLRYITIGEVYKRLSARIEEKS